MLQQCWGTEFTLNAVFNIAFIFDFGLGKYMPNAAILGDMDWIIIWYHQWLCIYKNRYDFSACQINVYVNVYFKDKCYKQCQRLQINTYIQPCIFVFRHPQTHSHTHKHKLPSKYHTVIYCMSITVMVKQWFCFHQGKQ
jgi:hypothetical protein